MTSSTKPEIHNESLTPRDEDRITAVCNTDKDLVKFGRVVFELFDRTDRRYAILITILRTPLGDEDMNASHCHRE